MNCFSIGLSGPLSHRAAIDDAAAEGREFAMFEDLNDLYQQVIIDHSKKPRNFRVMEGANRRAAGQNPLCGDNYTVFMLMENDVVKDVSFQGDGCAISKASASLMTEALKGKTKAEAEKI